MAGCGYLIRKINDRDLPEVALPGRRGQYSCNPSKISCAF